MKTPLLTLLAFVETVCGHGQINVPASNRHGGSLKLGGNCNKGECVWFTNEVSIPGWPTLPDEYRTLLRNISNGSKHDYFTNTPWRAPGTAPVRGHGCGVGAGGPNVYGNGDRTKGIPQGGDALDLPRQPPAVWHPGDEVEVAVGFNANHGGGWSWRLCKNVTGSNQGVDGFTEECFQNGTLDFAGNTSWIVWPDGRRIAFPRVTVTEGTYPKGSAWARNPIPGCYYCDMLDTCGPRVKPHPMKAKNFTLPSFLLCWELCVLEHRKELEQAGCKYPQTAKDPADLGCQEAEFRACGKCEGDDIDYDFMQQVICNTYCDGHDGGACIPGTAQFPPVAPEISGTGQSDVVPAWEWSVMDLIKIPDNLEPGDYLLSWRWDCEETNQIWQNCADISIQT